MNLETKITIYKFTPQVFTLTLHHPIHNILRSIFRNHTCVNVISANSTLYYPISAGRSSSRRKPKCKKHIGKNQLFRLFIARLLSSTHVFNGSDSLVLFAHVRVWAV